MTRSASATARLQNAIWSLLTEGAPIVITSHVRADGDAVGASLALYHALKNRHTDARLLLQPPLPRMLEFLPGLDERTDDPDRLPPSYHLMVLDCGELERIGPWADRLGGRIRTINVDHHTSNSRFGDLNLVEPQASSCGELIYRMLVEQGEPIGPEIAECIYTAIVTDTGQFAFENTTPEALEACAACVRAGARAHVLADRLFMSPTPAQFALRQMAADTLEFHAGGRLATIVVTREMFRQTDLGPVDTERFANIPLHIHGVAASALLKEMPDGDYIKVSLRSRAPVDVCAVARLFGGGGHTRAAGCEIKDDLAGARRAVLERLAAQVNVASQD